MSEKKITAADINAALKRAAKKAPFNIAAPMPKNHRDYQKWRDEMQAASDAFDDAVREEARKLFGGGE